MPSAKAQPPLLRDVFDIKRSISTSDYVLKLAEAVTPEGSVRALDDYVVTERLLENFDEALSLIKASQDAQTSKAVYLHGSFGSGKSHFMAVLHALLRGDRAARKKDEFAPLLAKHSSWLGDGGSGPKFLLVPYHMLGAKSLEQRILGGYVSHIKELHPEAPTPPVYRTDALFENIRQLRRKIGDKEFIKGLGGEDDEWGDDSFWTPELLDRALSAEQVDFDDAEGDDQDDSGPKINLVDPRTPAEFRARLVHDALEGWFPGFFSNAREDEHGFISLDAGLAVIAEHARSLGYDGLILFMDELILWLANRIHDQKFVSREADKITNFVEGGDARRAVPIVSFIARQRDLRELVGQEVSGAAEAAIQDTLNLASGRFDTITLEDRNLPVIANKRLLRPKSDEAFHLIDAAFAKAKRVGPQVWDILLGSEEGTTGADEASFRLTYPFSPAFMDTLVHISSALQRSRTGLKLMGQLLADRWDDARLEQLIPLGDLYGVIARGGDEPFVEKLKHEFKAADKLYRTKLRPYLLDTYGLTEEDVEEAVHRPDTSTERGRRLQQSYTAFAGDNRLICTLLLSALAPSVPALRELTIRRLTALNHGSITSPIPGGEVGIVTAKVSEWASRFAEIKETGTRANAGVRLELVGVDVDSIIANANVNNNPGNRRALLRRLLWDELGISSEDRLTGDELHLTWRGSHRTVEVVSGNIADPDNLPDHEFVPSQEGMWRLVIAMPYDEGSFVPVDCANRVREMRAQPGERQRTLAWIPTHFSSSRFQDFQRLVTIDYALADTQRFATQYASHLNADNRERARSLLEGQRDTLVKAIKATLKQAYGLAPKQPSDVVVDYDEHLIALRDVPELRLPVGQSLRDGVRHVAGTLLRSQFPAHPDFDPDGTGAVVRAADAKVILSHIRAAGDQADRRLEIPDRDRSLMRRVASQLGLGVQKEAYFELSRHWVEHFNQQARGAGVTGDLPVWQLAEWVDRPEPMGLDDFLVHLIVAAYAELDDRVWVRERGPLDPPPELNAIRGSDALRRQPLPDEAGWAEAGRRYAEIFGEQAPSLRRGRLVGQFARGIQAKAAEYRPHVEDLVRHLEKHQQLLGLDGADDSGRLNLARQSLALLDSLLSADRGATGGTGAAKQVVDRLAGFDLGGIPGQRYGASIKQAKAVTQALVSAPWDILQLATTYGPEGQAVLDALRGAARVDELTASLPDALAAARRDLLAVMKQARVEETPLRVARPPSVAEPVKQDPGSVDLSTPTSQPPIPIDAPAGEDSGTPRTGRRSGGTGARSGGRRTTAARAAAELRAELAELAVREPDATIEIAWRVVE